MCRFCDCNDDWCEIWYEPMSHDWYLAHETGEWDTYNDGWVVDRIYINYCPWCGENLEKRKVEDDD